MYVKHSVGGNPRAEKEEINKFFGFLHHTIYLKKNYTTHYITKELFCFMNALELSE